MPETAGTSYPCDWVWFALAYLSKARALNEREGDRKAIWSAGKEYVTLNNGVSFSKSTFLYPKNENKKPYACLVELSRNLRKGSKLSPGNVSL